MTARTPGRAFARVVSIRTMRACACGHRSSLPCSMPGMLRSSAYSAWPQAFGIPSFFGVGWPTTSKVLRTGLFISAPALLLELPGRVLDSLDDLDIAGAAAQMADHGVPYFVFARLRIFVEQRCRRDDKTRCAEATLNSTFLYEGFLDLIEHPFPHQAFDCANVFVLRLDRKIETRID